jgi:hypothetical protein
VDWGTMVIPVPFQYLTGASCSPQTFPHATTRGVATRCYPCSQQAFRCQGKTAFGNRERLAAGWGKSVFSGASALGLRGGGVSLRGDR